MAENTTIRALVARMDGTAASGFAPGSISDTKGIPVTRNFDPRQPPVGIADLVVEGSNVYADIRLRDGVNVEGLFPAVGGRDPMPFTSERPVHVSFRVLEVSLCDSGNVDKSIPPIDGRTGESQ